MDIVGIIGLIFTGLGLLAALLWWVARSARAVGIKETEIKHEDQSLDKRVTDLESDIKQINAMLQGTEFWDQMRNLIKDVKDGTKRHDKPDGQ